MRILFLTHSFNSLTQRLFVELTERGHVVSVEFDINDSITREAVALFHPDLIIAPFLKRAIPEDVWRRHLCMVVHPGPKGDRGPSALDWAVLDGVPSWGVTVLQAEAEFDAGDIWASHSFPMRTAAKGSLYRNEVTEAAVKGVLEAVAALQQGRQTAEARDDRVSYVAGRPRPVMRQRQRRIDWSSDDTATILRKIRSGDGFPGVLDDIEGLPVYLFDACAESTLSGPPGTIIAKRGGAICRATADGAIWIGHLRVKAQEPTLKLPATMILSDGLRDLPEAPTHEGETYRDLWYEEEDGVGCLHFPFYNGAMSTGHCRRLRAAFNTARRRPTRVIVLMGGPDFWSNGLHLNTIEAADSPADESWRNINEIDNLVRDIITTDSHYVVAAVRGNAGAGGVFMALAADRIVARHGIVLNPHYKNMGNLYGSEYWTYLLPRRLDRERAEQVVAARLPMGTVEAHRLGMIDEVIDADGLQLDRVLRARAKDLAADSDLPRLLDDKRARLQRDQAAKSLETYRAAELQHMKLNFYGFDPSFHVARYNFVHKVPKSHTPLAIAKHRRIAQSRTCRPETATYRR